MEWMDVLWGPELGRREVLYHGTGNRSTVKQDGSCSSASQRSGQRSYCFRGPNGDEAGVFLAWTWLGAFPDERTDGNAVQPSAGGRAREIGLGAGLID